ncbi:DNA-binding MarR family transcriptional regulator [Nocardia puris]|uniref:DNA-binding MarR family transcriptional regulator n=2 Tax=Nocardia puris TaxID=208602 RepID=A0A366E3Z0_9NOCA|nr:DNA-binding MarR family transcriptional regulator [Nocardia puris]
MGAELSDAVVVFHEAVGALLGLSATDHKALGVLGREGPMSGGELARRLSLSPAAVSGIADRLVAAELVERTRDDADRRRSVLTARPIANPRYGRAFADLRAAMAAVSATFTPEELGVIATWVTRTTAVLRDQAARLAAPE